MTGIDSPPPGDPTDYEAFVSLFVAHEVRLRGFLRAMLPAWSDVDEVLQETSLLAWRKFGQFERGTSFMAWVTTIARFEALDHLRRRGREQRVFSPAVLELLAQEAASDADALERERAALDHCLGKLEPAQREALLLAYQPGARQHETAARTGRSVQGFYKLVQRLRSRLLECIRMELKEEAV